MSQPSRVRVGYISGNALRVNEKVIDEQWISFLGEYCELVAMPPYDVIRLLGGAFSRWAKLFPESLVKTCDELERLLHRYQVQFLYLNVPQMIPYLLMARNARSLNLGFLFIAHCVGSEPWLKQWIGIAPWLSSRDVLLASTASAKRALLQISNVYCKAKHIPLCIDLNIGVNRNIPREPHQPTILSIGRLEDVKNIDLFIECVARVKHRIPRVRAIVAGEITGYSESQKTQYERDLKQRITRLGLLDTIELVGPVIGWEKELCFSRADLLVNLSTDPGETFGMNLLEAKSRGLPVVCTRWDGFCELVEDGVDGYLVHCNWEDQTPGVDLADLVEKVTELLLNSRVRHSMTAAALKRAQEFDYRVTMPKVLEELSKAASTEMDGIPEVERTSLTEIGKMDSIYNIDSFNFLPHFVVESPLSILSLPSVEPLESWFPRVKPIIRHYAGGEQDANLSTVPATEKIR